LSSSLEKKKRGLVWVLRNLEKMKDAMKSQDAPWTIEGLPAEGPDPESKEKLELFGQFVGDWDILECRYEDGDTWSTSEGELHWRWILEGKAVQDVWSTIDKETHRVVPGGTTIRFYDPKIDAWRSTWISPEQGVVKMFIGRKVGEEIVLELVNQEKEEGRLVKWVFSEITSTSFHWRAEESRDAGKTWEIHEEMKIRRKKKN
jgi:hypothetical protein